MTLKGFQCPLTTSPSVGNFIVRSSHHVTSQNVGAHEVMAANVRLIGDIVKPPT